MFKQLFEVPKVDLTLCLDTRFISNNRIGFRAYFFASFVHGGTAQNPIANKLGLEPEFES